MKKNIFIYLPQQTVGMSAMLIKELCWVAAAQACQKQGAKLSAGNSHQIKLVSLDGEPVRCFSGNSISVDTSLKNIKSADALFVGAFWGETKKVLKENRALLPILQASHEAGIPIAAVSNGPFFLAEAELLENKHATVYPPLISTFQNAYPNVDLRFERAITDAGQLYCANGIASGCDLIVAVLEQLFGLDVAKKIRAEFLLGFNRNYSLVDIHFDGQKYHRDQQILAAQQWLEHNFYQQVRFDKLAAEAGLSTRHFSRRFKKATGDNPSHYLQRIRVEVAKELLTNTNLSNSEIADRVGYRDSNYFRQLFKKYQGGWPQDFS